MPKPPKFKGPSKGVRFVLSESQKAELFVLLGRNDDAAMRFADQLNEDITDAYAVSGAGTPAQEADACEGLATSCEMLASKINDVPDRIVTSLSADEPHRLTLQRDVTTALDQYANCCREWAAALRTKMVTYDARPARVRLAVAINLHAYKYLGLKMRQTVNEDDGKAHAVAKIVRFGIEAVEQKNVPLGQLKTTIRQALKGMNWAK